MSSTLAQTTISPRQIETTRKGRSPSGARSVPSPSHDLGLAITRATSRIPPLWPLKNFVAVNPFLGLAPQTFEEASQTMKRVAGANMLLPRRRYRALIAEGRITQDDLRDALKLVGNSTAAPKSLSDLNEAINDDPKYIDTEFATVTETLDRVHGLETDLLMVGEVSKWCAAYWDEGQAAWTMPWRRLPFYAAWRASTSLDRTAEVMGFAGFRGALAHLPADPVATIEAVVEALGVPDDVLESYLHRALFSVRGWASYARYLGWFQELEGHDDDTVTQVLAVRLAWEYALFTLHSDTSFREAWQESIATMEGIVSKRDQDRDLLVDAILQSALEASYRRALAEALATPWETSGTPKARAPLQMAFCIDVRSEVFRRALENVAPEAETIGFAGFFGFPIEYVPIGQTHGQAHCPVLLTPNFVVPETVAGASDDEMTEILGLRLLRRRASKAWKSFKSSAVSSFVFVETAGLAFAVKLISDATGTTRTVTHPSADGLDANTVSRLAPDIKPGALGSRRTGLDDEQRIQVAENVLRAMSLTRGFARLVVFAGHGSTTVNNPHASGYDCGACGGNPGDANARVAASVLNDERVRAALRQRGIDIPDDTWFVGALHDTTTDEIRVFDRDGVPESHLEDLRGLDGWVERASSMARLERSALLNTGTRNIEEKVIARSRDWSQVRPEWGLARNAAFIAAPRARTRGVDLEGRVFLHDYDSRQDADWTVLESILTAPVVVATWINLQYYGSAVDREAFSSGNKVLHNVVGTLGVLEGNGGDLKAGLPWQSIHDGHHLVHEPLRLSVFIEAPTEQIDAVLDKHANVRQLVDNGWLHLLALGDGHDAYLRDRIDGQWLPVAQG